MSGSPDFQAVRKRAQAYMDKTRSNPKRPTGGMPDPRLDSSEFTEYQPSGLYLASEHEAYLREPYNAVYDTYNHYRPYPPQNRLTPYSSEPMHIRNYSNTNPPEPLLHHNLRRATVSRTEARNRRMRDSGQGLRKVTSNPSHRPTSTEQEPNGRIPKRSTETSFITATAVQDQDEKLQATSYIPTRQAKPSLTESSPMPSPLSPAFAPDNPYRITYSDPLRSATFEERSAWGSLSEPGHYPESSFGKPATFLSNQVGKVHETPNADRHAPSLMYGPPVADPELPWDQYPPSSKDRPQLPRSYVGSRSARGLLSDFKKLEAGEQDEFFHRLSLPQAVSTSTQTMLQNFRYSYLREQQGFIQLLAKQKSLLAPSSLRTFERTFEGADPSDKESEYLDYPDGFMEMLAEVLAQMRLMPSKSDWESSNPEQKESVRRLWSQTIDSLCAKSTAAYGRRRTDACATTDGGPLSAYLDYISARQEARACSPPPLPPRPPKLSRSSSHSSDRWVEHAELYNGGDMITHPGSPRDRSSNSSRNSSHSSDRWVENAVPFAEDYGDV